VNAGAARAVHQLLPSYVPGDAVSAHARAVHELLVELGARAHVWASAWRTGAGHPTVRSWRELRPEPGSVLLYHLSTGSRMVDWLAERTEPLVVDHHNVTPPELVEAWDPARAVELAAGRRQVAVLAPRAVLGLADSAWNRAELDDAGYRTTAVAPVLLDPARRAVAPDAATAAALARSAATGGRDWLFVGRIAPSKGQRELVAAFTAHRRLQDPQARLHLVGGTSSPAYADAVRAVVADADDGDPGLRAAVRIWGEVPDPVLCALYAAADVFVSCSAHEGFGVPLVEAMWWGVPVVAVGAAAVPETVAGAGLVLPAGDPLLVAEAAARVLGDAAVRATLVAAGRLRADELSLARARTRMGELLRPVLDGAA
jgi:glycosyltransferase involved in cell wall biosynthesis